MTHHRLSYLRRAMKRRHHEHNWIDVTVWAGPRRGQTREE